MIKDRAFQFHRKVWKLLFGYLLVVEKNLMGDGLYQKPANNCSTIVVRNTFGVCSIAIAFRPTLHGIYLLYKTYLVHFCCI